MVCGADAGLGAQQEHSQVELSGEVTRFVRMIFRDGVGLTELKIIHAVLGRPLTVFSTKKGFMAK